MFTPTAVAVVLGGALSCLVGGVHRALLAWTLHLPPSAVPLVSDRSAIYLVRTPQGYPLAARLAARLEQARAEQQAGVNPLGLSE